MSFADYASSRRKINTRFFDQIDALIDWRSVEKVIDEYDVRGKGIAGNAAYPGLVLFKMNLLGIWYGLSDRELEDRVNDSLSFSRFCGLSLSDPVPDHSIVSRFRTMMTHQGAWDMLLGEINRQLDRKGIILRSGTIVDASITETPRKPKGKTQYEIEGEGEPVDSEEKGTENPPAELRYSKAVRPGQDTEAAWTKKAGKLYYGYKKHHATDLNGLVLAVETTPANIHDIKLFQHLIEQVSPLAKTPVLADKGYCGKEQAQYLRSKQLINGVQKKAVRSKKLSAYHLKKNKEISKMRYVVERTFGGQKRWFGAGVARYMGLARTHTQHLLEAICYNLKRAPRLYAETLLQPALNG